MMSVTKVCFTEVKVNLGDNRGDNRLLMVLTFWSEHHYITGSNLFVKW